MGAYKMCNGIRGRLQNEGAFECAARLGGQVEEGRPERAEWCIH